MEDWIKIFEILAVNSSGWTVDSLIKTTDKIFTFIVDKGISNYERVPNAND